LAWASNSVSHPPAKRAVALALINCISQLGNVAGSYVFFPAVCGAALLKPRLPVTSGHHPGVPHIIPRTLFAFSWRR
jgi:hypothetical protein